MVKLSAFADRVIRRIAARDPARVLRKMERPRASIAAGSAGVALFLAEAARTGDGAARERAAEQALAWIKAAEQTLRNPRSAAGFPGSPIERCFRVTSVFHGRAGVHTVAARVASVRGDAEALRGAAVGFVNAWRAVCARKKFPTEAFFGCAGFIHAARDFDAHADALGPTLSECVRTVGSEAHARVCKSFARLARRALPHGTLLGYAHGVAGELDAALAWEPRSSAVVAAVLDQLLSLVVVEEELAAWPMRVGEEVGGPLWASWCNGMAGHVYLWCRAYEVFRDERYLTAARLSARTTAVLRPGNPSVCCGTAGQAFALHRYYRLTGDSEYLRFAVAHARRACAQGMEDRESDLTYFGGLSGIAHLAFTIDARRPPCLPLIDNLLR